MIAGSALSTRQLALLQWSAASRRELPWRETRDPWLVLVSELMLAQTQVERVIPKYVSFVELFPTASTCANASVGDIVRAWAGLGYNRRAVNLHRCAVQIVETYRGVFPQGLAELLALPGVGPYTARAVMAFAWDRDVGVVDTNAGRVLARLEGRSLARAECQSLADAAVPAGYGWAWNQAILDLGATICTSRAPKCALCPLVAECAWNRSGCGEPDPARGSAGTSVGQSTFEGSVRQGRGRVIAHLSSVGRIPESDFDHVAGWPVGDTRTRAMIDSLVRDGLALRSADGSLALP